MPKDILKILLKKLDELYVLGYFKSTDDYELIINTINALNTLILNTLDVVEVVRCKDCKYFTPQPDTIEACCDLTYSRALPNDYCSYAERRKSE